jgi:murein DD-endopeptidase MepM/ murein hydrolase activator NlpD
LTANDHRGSSRPASRAIASGRRWLLTATAFPLVAAGALLVTTPPDDELPRSIDLTDLVATAVPSAPVRAPVVDGPDSVEVTVQRNDTLDRIFRSTGIEIAELAELRALPDARKALDMLRPGDIITLTHANGALQSLNRRISDTLTLSISRGSDGFAVNYIENPLEMEVTGRRARIETSMFEAGQAAGMSAETIMVLANEIFGWDVDFALDIRQGDEFSVLYQQKFQDGAYVSDGRVLAAEFVNNGRTHRAVWFESADGEVRGYYTPEGRGMRKAFLRAPLDFTRISSRFNPRRVHPVSGRIRAHKGIDYAAPTGTPIWAAGDGRVEFAGRKGGYGNAVIINHGRGVTTLYAHMSRFAKSTRSGRTVKQGQVVGYVGSTGASTGPHLHYEYRVKGAHKNPASIPLPSTEIPASHMAEFRAQAEIALAQLELTSGAPAQAFASR